MTADTERDALVANLRARQDIRGTFRLMDDAADQIRRDGERIAELEAALIRASGALGDIYDGEPEFDDAGELEWCRGRAKEGYIEARAALAKAGKSDPIKNVKEPQ